MLEMFDATEKQDPFKAVHVTVENIDEVAKWCHGISCFYTGDEGTRKQCINMGRFKPCVKIGDWVIRIEGGFYCMTTDVIKRDYDIHLSTVLEEIEW